MSISPREEYARRLDTHRAVAARRARLDARLADARLVVFGIGLTWAVLAYLEVVGTRWLAAFVAVFAGLVVVHLWAASRRKRAERAAAYFELGLARIDDTWMGRGEPGSQFLDEDHPYAADLDIFGPGSLFERLCTARTSFGRMALADWLREPASPEVVAERQAAVAESRPRLDLREDLALLGEDVASGLDPKSLLRWSEAEPRLRSRVAWRIADVLAALAVFTLVGWLIVGTGFGPFGAVMLAHIGFAGWHRRRVKESIADIQELSAELALMGALLARLEREEFESALLTRLRTDLDADGQPPSRQIARLAGLAYRLEARENQIFTIPSLLILWTTRSAFALEAWRARSGPKVAVWLRAAGQFESLFSLAAYAFENPDDPFPVIVEGTAAVEAEGLGHPLIPLAKCVRNDVGLGGEAPRVLVVSGSNMSGKSTLLRSLGVNVVLAQAGAPVRAKSLRMSPLSLGATLRVQDSLQAGRSRFFAEISRVRQVVDLARGPIPLLFLLDELFNGTNSHDRRLGAEAVVRGLVELGAIGLVTTHDLALAEIVEALGPRAANVHFEDRMDEGVMRFDYTMRPGVVRHSNALELMRAVGLEV